MKFYQLIFRFQLSLISLFVAITVIAVCVHFRFEFLGYPEIKWDPYSQKHAEMALADKKIVLVLLRSKYSFWQNEVADTDFLRKAWNNGKIEAFELIWDWEQQGLEQPFFETLGFNKDALIVILENDQPDVAIAGLERQKFFDEVRFRLDRQK